mgnify:CR=1 FL=1
MPSRRPRPDRAPQWQGRPIPISVCSVKSISNPPRDGSSYCRGPSARHCRAQAQALGYAEADPTFDIEGVDAAHKLTIVAAISFGIPMQFSEAYTEGKIGRAHV